MSTPSKPRDCHLCGTRCTSFCPTCTAAFSQRRDVATMTAEERVTELEQWCGPLEIEFSLLHQRIEELVGRSVWTHELAHPEQLAAEIRSGQPLDFGGVVGKVTDAIGPERVIVVATDSEAPS